MGSGQSNGRPEEPGARRAGHAPAGPPSSMAERIMASNGQAAPAVSSDVPRGNPAELPSPRKGKDAKGDRHVAIAVADPRLVMYKGQKGGLLDKLKGVTSRNNSFMSTVAAVVGRAASHANAPGSRAGSDRSTGSHTSRRAKGDEYDVESGEEDLEGFIYEDESTSEDEREDYVNAFGRRRKLPKADDYSDYEGAGARALTAGGRKPPKSAAMRRGARKDDKDEDEDGDDEFDPEEERIRQLRQKKKQEERERAKAVAHATLAVANASLAVATMKVGAGASKANGKSVGLGSAASGPSSSGPSRSVVIVEPGQSDDDGPMERHQEPQHVRISPQPPPEPPTRGGSGNLRRGAAAAAAAAGSGYGSSAGGGAGGSGGGSVPGPGPGSGASGPSVNYGASASSQYWQGLRATQTDALGNDDLAGREPSRLEQLAALQRKRQERQERQERQRNADEGGGVRWREETQTSQAPSQQPDRRSGGQERGEQQERSVRWGRQGLDSEDHGSSPATTSEWRHERSSSSNTTTTTTTTTSTVATSSSRQLLPNRESAPGGGPPPTWTSPLHPPPLPRDSDVPVDFDVDEVLNSFATPGGPRQNGDGWRGPQAPTGPPSAPPADGYTSSGKRSIRAVQSDFTSMRNSEAADDVVDLASRMLSLPMAAPRPVQPATDAGPAPGGATSTPAASSASRFARLGANLMSPGAGSTATAADGPGAGNSAAAWAGGGTTTGTVFVQRISGAAGYRRTALLNGSERTTSTGGTTENVALPAIRPPSGSLVKGISQELAARSSGGGASSITHPHARTRFGATQHQQFQQQSVQEAAGLRASAPMPPSQRDYDSDSAVLRNASPGCSKHAKDGPGWSG
ncbi:hypothetical protein TSOC_006859 [Tetrabaena socialis]|uniref:Uncharacterized protein n=1 Tax=Tetrabaena socialis TaxID=47790 RepID=A0A2J8A2I6_9CHLO|nr:hypothetical protein TSOC_006859 [Tetrabaena socialis]|eukprot:PNH06736.1 hypothetical protein TSOC_006859 [Tetrabaena socialis]